MNLGNLSTDPGELVRLAAEDLASQICPSTLCCDGRTCEVYADGWERHSDRFGLRFVLSHAADEFGFIVLMSSETIHDLRILIDRHQFSACDSLREGLEAMDHPIAAGAVILATLEHQNGRTAKWSTVALGSS